MLCDAREGEGKRDAFFSFSIAVKRRFFEKSLLSCPFFFFPSFFLSSPPTGPLCPASLRATPISSTERRKK